MYMRKNLSALEFYKLGATSNNIKNEPRRGKTNNVVSEQVRHKPACISTEKN